MHQFADPGEVRGVLGRLIGRELVLRLERRPGQKEERYAQLLEGAAEEDMPTPAPLAPAAAPSFTGLEELSERVERLERAVGELRAAMRDPAPVERP
jgi:uncharacterized protein